MKGRCNFESGEKKAFCHFSKGRDGCLFLLFSLFCSSHARGRMSDSQNTCILGAGGGKTGVVGPFPVFNSVE